MHTCVDVYVSPHCTRTYIHMSPSLIDLAPHSKPCIPRYLNTLSLLDLAEKEEKPQHWRNLTQKFLVPPLWSLVFLRCDSNTVALFHFPRQP